MNAKSGSDSNRLTIEEELVFAERLLQGVAESTRSLLTIRNYEESIQSALAILGEATQVDRVYVFRHHLHLTTQAPLVSQMWEWVKSGVPPEIDNPALQNLPCLEVYPRWYQILLGGNSVSGLTDSFPESEQMVLIPQSILSIVLVPIMIQDEFWGFMGFDDCQNGHRWSHSEVAVLQAVAHSFGGAIARHDAETNLQKANETLKIQASELLKAKDEANQASRAKSMFLANMSHELRTPLNGILGYTQILQRSIRPVSIESRGVQVIHQCATHLLTLINDILDFSKIEANQLVIAPVPLDLRVFLNEIVDIFRIQASIKNISLARDLSSNLPTMVAVDAQRLRQVLLNLLSNAIKFTDSGQVTLSVTLENNQQPSDLDQTSIAFIHFAIIDTGIGISSKDIQRIFNPFEQVGDLGQQADGTGLGLNISQRILSAMNSSIRVESLLNVGSTFSFTLELPVITDQSHAILTSENEKTEADIKATTRKIKPVEARACVPKEAIPPVETLQYCWELVQAGRLKKLMQYIESISQPEPSKSQFLQKIANLAVNYDIEEIEKLLSMHLKHLD